MVKTSRAVSLDGMALFLPLPARWKGIESPFQNRHPHV